LRTPIANKGYVRRAAYFSIKHSLQMKHLPILSIQIILAF